SENKGPCLPDSLFHLDLLENLRCFRFTIGSFFLGEFFTSQLNEGVVKCFSVCSSLQLRGSSLGDQFSVGQKSDPRAQPLSLGHVVRRKQNRCALPGAQLFEKLLNVAAALWIESSRSLVEQQQRRIDH